MGKRSVLIVDDQEMNRDLLGGCYEDKFPVLFSEDGGDAVEQIKEKSDEIGLILLDLKMPVADGFVVLDYMKREHLDSVIPVFVVTADDSAESFRRLSEYIVADVISKPYMPQIILRRTVSVMELYDNKRREMEEIYGQMQDLQTENEKLREQIKAYEKRFKAIGRQLGFEE